MVLEDAALKAIQAGYKEETSSSNGHVGLFGLLSRWGAKWLDF
jgi:hypothetical protein